MKYSQNKIGITALIIAFFALVIGIYTSYSEAMNDGVYNTPAYLIKIITPAESKQVASSMPEMKAETFALFDEEKKILFYSFSIFLIIVSTLLCIKSYRKTEHSLYYSTAVLFSLAAFAVINNILFVAYFIVVSGYAYYIKHKNITNSSSGLR